ncbi:signal recognition particle-docking protein FtsY [Dietzia cinnamea]|uniref:Signal recognition particle receptor FtsY n=1 Tax=Dietzia cinnamea TaxID=321318 RepID=A0ABV3YL43_9ACTN|nr:MULTISPECIES: signal recognition particle-docking protein FtsY [Dietzia]KZO59606.1 signal recognition particle-docking protein FtsY [Dietzia maris]MCT2059170.1 signal recognition particle-docking protein FtsY [Dietzia cinnamea]MCT2099419.1 signal recognition particle-docking protein FtsY [Dietzia cinnamea]MCT2144492.1 signal recognition particle-docking protein FtsY [Dietzia cinnamea]MCT2304484.1 signal recognition particle-docking protein FtsY [Dietzia cinnamea]
MTTTTWIIIAVAAVLLLAVIALVVGLQLRKKRQISLTKAEERKELTREERSGNYQAGTGFSFAQGGGVAAPAKEPIPREEPRSAAAPTAPPAAPPAPEGGAGVDAAPGTPVVQPDVEPGPSADTEVVEPAPVEPVVAPPEVPSDEVPAPTTEGITGTPEPVAPVERIDPATGRLDRLRGRLARSQNTVGQGLLGLLGAGDLDEGAWEEIEDTLIMADLGATTTQRVVDRLREEIATRQVRTEAEVRDLLRQTLIDNLHPEYDRSLRALPNDGTPAVLLVVGVNGTGKTTTTGKLARVLVADGRAILLGAADTFRAAAADQLQTWAERVGAEVVRGKEGADPASVAFDAVRRGVETGVDAVLVDTAGRLHTKAGLMDELGKVKRVVEKKTPVDEVLLVIDATTGQNGLMQARVFKEVVDITGVVLTKLDGTAKGGIVFQVQHELGVPVKLVGLGEGADDLAPFTPEAFVDALLGT